MLRLKSKAMAEFIGTFAIVFAGCGAIMISERFSGFAPSGQIPFVFGLMVTAMIYALGHISGAHFNPAVTMGFAVARHFPWKEVVAYWIAQILGAILAIGLLHLILPAGVEYGATLPKVPPLAAIVWEAVLTFFLMFVIIAVATDTRAVGVMAGFAIGATVALNAMVGGPVTGASMNPARSLGPALFQGEWGSLWIYVVGPAVGAVAASLTYEWIRCETDKKKAKGCC